ncbi:uncharacterized protein ACNS7B_017707 [Menidia menidia]
MRLFSGVEAPPGSAPPPLRFFRALLLTAAPGDRLPAPLSLTGVRLALGHGDTQLVTHALTQNKLTLSEDLGDVLTEHAQKRPSAAAACLPLATAAYEASGALRKAALSMCSRGLVHAAAAFMRNRLTADDCLWVLRCCPRLQLLQQLTAPPHRPVPGGDQPHRPPHRPVPGGDQRRPAGRPGPAAAGAAAAGGVPGARERGPGAGGPGGRVLLGAGVGSGLGGGCGAVFWSGPGPAGPGPPPDPAGSPRNRLAVPGPGGGAAHGARLPVRPPEGPGPGLGPEPGLGPGPGLEKIQNRTRTGEELDQNQTKTQILSVSLMSFF